VLKAQAIGSLTRPPPLSGLTRVMYAIKGVGLLRVSGEGESHGLDLHEHGISAYRNT